MRYIKLGKGDIRSLALLLSPGRGPRDRTENQAERVHQGQGQAFARALEQLELYDIECSTALEGDIRILNKNPIAFEQRIPVLY